MPKRNSTKGGKSIARPRRRDYKTEYRRRIERALFKGLSRSQARGHPKPSEPTISARKSPKPLSDEQLQRALRILRQEKSLSAAAKAARVSPERLKRFAHGKGAIEKQKRLWTVSPDLPRRMLLYSHGKELVVIVGDSEAASLIGRYMAGVGTFLTSNDRRHLKPFVGQTVTDSSGKSHPLETNPNTLYRLSSSGESFEQVYRIVV